MSQPVRWGILGTGNIARQFAHGVASARRSSLSAVGSRTADTARHFAEAHRIPTSHASYDQLLADPKVDAIYNSLPNSLHHEWTIKSLRAGKHVLCEKPFAVTTAEAQEMFDVARQCGRLVIEAFMYRCHPLTVAVQQALARGVIGELKYIRTSFCYRTSKIVGNVRFDRALAGGGLMDVGCYCTSFSRLFAGCEPSRVQAFSHFHSTGVDDLVTATMEFPNGILAGFACGMCAQADNTATLNGTEGYIEIPIPWKPPQPECVFIIARGTPPKMDGKTASPVPPRETVRVTVDGDLYGIEADAFAACVLDGKAPFVSHAETLGNMRVLDQIRAAWHQT
jgi:D-xylose 1-dehydrogenase (NADP+, D-xylono-1,5-lactone-forming)